LREVAESFNAAVESLTIAGPEAGIEGRPFLAKEPRMVHFFAALSCCSIKGTGLQEQNTRTSVQIDTAAP
jgi:hypothetical protein